MHLRSVFTIGGIGALALAAAAAAQPPDDTRIRVTVAERVATHAVRHVAALQRSDEDPCRDTGWDDDQFRTCEVREESMPAGPLTVDAGRNGGIRIEGADVSDIQIRAVVTTQARSEEAARQLASEVQVQAGSGKVSAVGPAPRDDAWWTVSYRITVPRRTDLDLQANNGGVSIRDVAGTMRFQTTNGGVRLTDLAGDVRGETRNGGLHVMLSGNRWDGAGLDVETSNGGVDLSIPEGYNAELTTRTVNGGFRTDFPMTIQGELSPRQGISTTLGAGGPPVRVRTTNGGLRINKR